MSEKTALIIDDDRTLLLTLKELLSQNGYNAFLAKKGTEGLILAKEKHPDVILLDRQMPEADGNHILIELKTDQATQHIPVIMLTGDNRIGDISSSLELGASDYVVKPFDLDNLIMRIETALKNADTPQRAHLDQL